jgi:hypothetical protein
MTSVCSIHQCGKKVASRGLCKLHYRRLQRHGDPLGGMVLQGTYLKYLNDVVLKYDGDECLTWPFRRREDGRDSKTNCRGIWR